MTWTVIYKISNSVKLAGIHVISVTIGNNCSGVSSDGGEIRETKRTNDSQVPQGSGLLSKLLQRSCQVGRVGERSERFRVVQQ